MRKKIIKRETTNSILLCLLFSAFMMTALSALVMLGKGQEEAFDLTRYDAESNILGFIPMGDSGLKYVTINEYPARELKCHYEGGDAENPKTRVLFKVGEWDLKEDLTEREEYMIDENTKLIKSTYWLETDLIGWTDLDYEDIFTNGDPNWQIEEEGKFKWLNIRKRYNHGWDPLFFNSWARISIWNNDLKKIVDKHGIDTINDWQDIWPWADNFYPYDSIYPNLAGLKALAADDTNYNKKFYEAYIRWNQIRLPEYGSYGYNIRSWSNAKWNEFSVKGDLYFDVNLKESVWNRLEFPDSVEVEEGGESVGKYKKDRVVLAIDNILTLGGDEEGSRTRIVDLQDIYDKTYSPHSAQGNWVATNPGNERQSVSDKITDILDDHTNVGEAKSKIPKDVIGDGVDIYEVIEQMAEWEWEEHTHTVGPEAELPGTASIEPWIWAEEEMPETITENDLISLKPLDCIDKTDFSYGLNLQDRSYGVFKTHIEFGPEILIDFAELQVDEIDLKIEYGILGELNQQTTFTKHSMIDHVPYAANVHNIGICHTLRLKMLALSTYDYEPYAATEPGEISPDFPLDDTEKDWPATIDDGGEVAFTQWKERENWFDALIGWFIQLGEALFGTLWWLIIPLMLGIVCFIIFGIIKFGVRKRSTKVIDKMEKLTEKELELQRLKQLSGEQSIGVHHIEGGEALKYSRIPVLVNIGLQLVFVTIVLYTLF